MRRSFLAILAVLATFSPIQAQWLTDDWQAYYRKMWTATGVEFPEGGKFYKLPRVSQVMAKTTNISTGESFERGGIYDANYGGENNINQQHPWITPAGLT